MQVRTLNSAMGLLRLSLVCAIFAAFLGGIMFAGVTPVRAETFDVTVSCPNVINYRITNDTNKSYQYYITVTDSQGNGLGSTAYSVFVGPGESLPEKSGKTLSLELVRVPAAGKLTVTLWRVLAGGSPDSVTSTTVQNCWTSDASTDTGVLAGTAAGTVLSGTGTSRIQYVCTTSGVDLSLTDAAYQVLPGVVTFGNQALLAAGADGIYQSVSNYGVVSVAGSQGWDGMYYYAAWNGGVYNANGQGDFALTFQCAQ